MASSMATGLMIQREFQAVLPSDAKTFSEDLEFGYGDVLVRVQTCGGEFDIRIANKDRIKSLNEIRDIYKPEIDAALHKLWTVS